MLSLPQTAYWIIWKLSLNVHFAERLAIYFDTKSNALTRKKLLSELSLWGGIPQQRSHDARGTRVAALRLPSMSAQQAQVEPFSPPLFQKRDNDFCRQGMALLHCSFSAFIQNVSIYKKGLVFTRKGADEPDALLQDILEIILYKRTDLGFWEVCMLIKPPEECVNMHLNWMLAVDTV